MKRRPLPSPFALLAIVALCGPLAVFGRGQEADEQPRVITRVYDIRDLLMQRRSYPAQSALVPPTRIGEPRPTPQIVVRATTQPDGAPQQTVGDMIRSLIQETVSPESWRDNGGAIGAMRELEGQLIVTQTAENHEQLINLLKQLRDTSARMVTIRAHWIFLKPGELKSVAKPLASDSALFAVDFAAVEKLNRPEKHYQAQVTCFNTQTVHVASGDARTVITEQQSNTGGGDNAVGYDARASIVQAGMTLEVTPVLTPDASAVMLDVQSVVSDWGSSPDNPRRGQPTTRPNAASASVGVPDIDHVQMLVQQLRTSVALPVGKPVIVGGMTFSPWVAEQDEQLYLVIEASASGNVNPPPRPRDAGEKPHDAGKPYDSP